MLTANRGMFFGEEFLFLLILNLGVIPRFARNDNKMGISVPCSAEAELSGFVADEVGAHSNGRRRYAGFQGVRLISVQLTTLDPV